MLEIIFIFKYLLDWALVFDPSFVNSGNTMNKVFQIPDDIFQIDSVYIGKDMEHSRTERAQRQT